MESARTKIIMDESKKWISTINDSNDPDAEKDEKYGDRARDKTHDVCQKMEKKIPKIFVKGLVVTCFIYFNFWFRFSKIIPGSAKSHFQVEIIFS